MHKDWIDNEGRLRLDHEENYQMVSYGAHIDDVDWIMDSWGIEHACKMIVLGHNENTKVAIEYGLKHCPEGTTGRDRARALITIMDRVLTLAKSAIAIGILKEADTPKNWLAWAQSKGYKTDHITPLFIDVDVGTGNHAGTETKPKVLSKLEKQQNAILKVIETKQFKPMAIPDNEKGTIKSICELENKNDLFKVETAFDRAWKFGIGKLWQMENHDSYAHRGNN